MLKVLTLRQWQYLMPGSTRPVPVSRHYSSPAYDNEYQGMGNLDYLVNSKNTLSTGYFITRWSRRPSHRTTCPASGSPIRSAISTA